MNKEVQDRIKEIASKYLSIETLEEQNSDDKDFHNLAVWDIENALLAAFESGAEVYENYRMDLRLLVED